MTTSGLLVTFDPNFAGQAEAMATIREAGPFNLGEAVDNRLPVGLEAPTPHDSAQWYDWLRRLPGVINIDVVSVEYEEREDTDDNP